MYHGVAADPGVDEGDRCGIGAISVFRPMLAGRDWPAEAVWPLLGLPRSVLAECEILNPSVSFAAKPRIVPETVGVDHGKIYVRKHLTSACVPK